MAKGFRIDIMLVPACRCAHAGSMLNCFSIGAMIATEARMSEA
jgi:hypothetical protein